MNIFKSVLNTIPRPYLIKLSYLARPVLSFWLKGETYTDPIDGKSLTPVLSGKSSLERDGIFIDFPHYTISFENIPSHAIVNQDWKLIRVYGEGPDRQNFYELYDLKKDIKEEINLAAFYQEVVKELDGQIEKHLEEAGCFRPVKNEAYDPDVTNPRIGMIRNEEPIIK